MIKKWIIVHMLKDILSLNYIIVSYKMKNTKFELSLPIFGTDHQDI